VHRGTALETLFTVLHWLYSIPIIIWCVRVASHKTALYDISFRRPQLEFTKLLEVRHSTFFHVNF
jgi:hypothetical protein